MNDNGYYSLPIYIESEEIAKKNIVELEDQHEGFYVAADWIYPTFVKNISKENIRNIRKKDITLIPFVLF
jgi:hypothetical protein